MMEKGQIYELMIDDMSAEGQGIGRITADGSEPRHAGGEPGNAGREPGNAGSFVVFVKGAVPGDRVQVRLTKIKKNYAFAALLDVVEKSPDRLAEPHCPHSDCGGCAFSMMNYSAQLKIKEAQVRNKLERLAGVKFAERQSILNPIVPSDAIFRYRNKASMPISTGGLMTRKGGIVEPVHEPRIGFRPIKSHEVINCEDCLLQAETAMAAAEATRRYMSEDNIASYDKRWDKGLMKGMTVKTAFGTGEVMVIYEINGKGVPNASKLIEYLDDAVYEAGGNLESVIIKNEKKSITLAGKSTINDVVEIPSCEALTFEISADSFYQVNPLQMSKLYGIVRDYCIKTMDGNEESFIDNDESGCSLLTGKSYKPVIFDLYCGIGTIGLCLADLAEKVKGVEIVKEAVTDANRNATINGIVNAIYECGKAEEIMPKWLEEERADIAVLDPPRAGCRPELLDSIAKAEIPHIIYVSCDPATLARDIKHLRDMGYELVEATPVDMFPHTSHVEVVVLLSRAQSAK